MSNVIDTLASLARKIEYSDTRLACRVDPDEHKCQIYLTSSSRPDAPEGIALLHLYYQIRILKNNLCKNDGKGFCATLCPQMKKHFTPEHFRKACKQLHDKMGKPVKGEFLAELAHPVFNISVWQVTFLKEIPGKKPEERQALFQVVTGEKDGKMQLLGFGFI